VTENGDSNALDSFGLSSQYAAGFEEFVVRLPEQATPQVMLKGQITGPFTLGTKPARPGPPLLVLRRPTA
jgi:hypothetical protein